MSERHEDDSSRKDAFAAYTLALVIAIVLTLLVGVSLRLSGCVPPDFFPLSRAGCSAVVFVCIACLLSLLFRGMKPPIWIGEGKFWKPIIRIPVRRRWIIELLILLPSIASLWLLIVSGGGVNGPYNAYLGTFPIVVSIVVSSRKFAVLTFVLTLGVYVYGILYVPPAPMPGHELHYNIASIFTFGASLAFTTMLIITGKVMRKADVRSVTNSTLPQAGSETAEAELTAAPGE